MMLIERGLKQDMAAEVDLEFDTAGVKATLRAPLPAAKARAAGPPAS
jgi:hypothetical protein